MKKYCSPTQAFAFLAILFWGTACNGPAETALPTEKGSESNGLAGDHPKLVKTLGNPRYGNVNCSLQDNTGNLWFGTTQNGLYRYDGQSFRQFVVADGLPSNEVSSLLQDKAGTLWIGTRAGLCRYDGKTFAPVPIPLPNNLPPNTNPYHSDSHGVSSMLQARNGKLWFVTIDGVYIYDGNSFTPFVIDAAANGMLTPNDKAERIFEDRAGNLWFGGRTNNGVYRYDGKSVTHLQLPELFQQGPTPKAHSWGWPQVQDKDGNIWFSNWGGAYRYDGTSFASFDLPGEIMRIVEDKKGNLWFGGNEFSRYDGKSFTRFTTKEGLATPGVWSILEDNTGKLWVGTRETALYLFDGKTFSTYSDYKPKPATNR